MCLLDTTYFILFTTKVRAIHTSLNFVHTLKTYLNCHASKNINMVSQRLYILKNECNEATAMLQRLTILYECNEATNML